jgi:hypothetical protein
MGWDSLESDQDRAVRFGQRISAYWLWRALFLATHNFPIRERTPCDLLAGRVLG